MFQYYAKVFNSHQVYQAAKTGIKMGNQQQSDPRKNQVAGLVLVKVQTLILNRLKWNLRRAGQKQAYKTISTH